VELVRNVANITITTTIAAEGVVTIAIVVAAGNVMIGSQFSFLAG